MQRRSLLITLALLAAEPCRSPCGLHGAWPRRSLQRLSEQARAIKRFEFDERSRRCAPTSARWPNWMKPWVRCGAAFSRFVEVTGVLAEETDFERLQLQLLKHTLPAVDAQAGVLYLAWKTMRLLMRRSAWRARRRGPWAGGPPTTGQQPSAVQFVAQALQNDDRTQGGRAERADDLDAARPHGAGCSTCSSAAPSWCRCTTASANESARFLLLCEGEPLPSRVRFARGAGQRAPPPPSRPANSSRRNVPAV